ncbi:MAG: GNAT family N-acetyltransferase [Rhodoferax sp.]
MASTKTSIPIETLQVLTPGTQAMLDRLVLQSGWNQTPRDWAIFLRQGSVYCARDAHGRIMASGAVLPMGDNVAWISMILVAPDARGKGLGSAVFSYCLRNVQASGRTAYLDATPDGERIYTQFGFKPTFRLTRWQRDALTTAMPAKVLHEHCDMETIAAMDARALGAPRSAVLADFLARQDTSCLCSDAGFAIVRCGRIAHQIGPLLALNETGAVELVKRAAQSLTAKIFVDVLDERASLRQYILADGFLPQRSFVRMKLGDKPLCGQSSLIHAIAGPEFG